MLVFFTNIRTIFSPRNPSSPNGSSQSISSGNLVHHVCLVKNANKGKGAVILYRTDDLLHIPSHNIRASGVATLRCRIVLIQSLFYVSSARVAHNIVLYACFALTPAPILFIYFCWAFNKSRSSLPLLKKKCCCLNQDLQDFRIGRIMVGARRDVLGKVS